MGVRLLHTADIHLRRDEPFRLDILSWILSKAKELARGLIIAGDLFENEIEASFLRTEVRQIFEKMGDFPVFIVPGNHDYKSYSPDTFCGKNVSVFYDLSSPVSLEGIRIIGIPFKPGFDFSTLIEGLQINPDTDIVVAHGTLYDQTSPGIYIELGEDARYMPIYRWDVENKIGYLALGHYHSRFIHLIYGKTQVVYPGSPIATSRRSVGVRYLALVHIDPGQRIEVDRIPVDISPYWKRMEWMVFPGKEERTIEKIKRDIQQIKGRNVMLDGNVTGSIAIGEVEFRKRLKEIEEKYQDDFRALELHIDIKHWANVLKNPTIASFVKKLGEINDDDLIKEKALELTLSALKRLRV